MESPRTTDPLVVGVDGSDASLTALDWAVDQAVRHGTTLRIVHASLWERYEGAVPSWSRHRPPEQVLAENIVATAAERARLRAPDLHVLTRVRAMDATGALLEEGGSALTLVVGSRGRGALAGLLLGSVALIVAARASCPVVVVRGDRHGIAARHGRVLLGVGDHDPDAPALRFAVREAVERGAELDAVRAWRHRARPAAPGAWGTPGDIPDERQASELLAKALDPVAHDHPDLRLRRSTVEGPAHRVLVDRSAAADLLVVGARRREGPVGLELGRVAHRALHHAACPVAVVPQRPERSAQSDGTDGPGGGER